MTASSTPKADAVDVVAMARQGRFDAIRGRLAAPLQALVTADALRTAWEAALDRCGAVVAVGGPIEEPAGAGVVVVKIPVFCERDGLTVLVSVARGGVLAGIQLAPPEAAAPTASADDLTRWQAGLGRRPDVTSRLYPSTDHFFFTGAGPSNPAELATARHVDPPVVTDVADWLDAPGR